MMPVITLQQTLCHLLDASDHGIFSKIDNLDDRCQQISALLWRHRSDPRQRLAAFYLGLFLDCHIPCYRDRSLPPIPLRELPASVMPSQLTMVDHIGDADNIIKRRPAEAIPAILARAFRITANIRHNIKIKPSDPRCKDIIQTCFVTSLTGNYMHAAFADPTLALTIRDRIAIFDTDFKTHPLTDVALSDYIISIIHDYCDRSQFVPFMLQARSNANACLRGRSTTPAMCSIIEKPNCAMPRIPCRVLVVGCAMGTGSMSTYLCTHCFAISAFVNGQHRGLQRMSIAADPFRERGDECVVMCHVCNKGVAVIDMHGKMLIYPGGYIIVVCPSCNCLSSYRDCLFTTVCEKCRAVAAVKLTTLSRRQLCYADNKRIPGSALLQATICRATRSLVFLPSCQYHYNKTVIAIV